MRVDGLPFVLSKQRPLHYEIANDSMRYSCRDTRIDDSSAAMQCITFAELKLVAQGHF